MLNKNYLHNAFVVVGLSGVEPLTSRLSGVRSNHLSYRPSFFAQKKNHLIKNFRLISSMNKKNYNKKRVSVSQLKVSRLL
jgi:hypothetical protein